MKERGGNEEGKGETRGGHTGDLATGRRRQNDDSVKHIVIFAAVMPRAVVGASAPIELAEATALMLLRALGKMEVPGASVALRGEWNTPTREE